MTAEIIGTGSCLPERVIDNQFLSGIVDTNDEWIVSRTGIKERRIAVEETTVSMSVKAARKALEDGKAKPEEIDLLIVATLSGDRVLPAASFEVQSILGAKNAVCFDLNAACSGFLFALTTAKAYIEAGIYKTALVIGAEVLSRYVDWTDRSTCILFGDGAGAAVVKAQDSGQAVLPEESIRAVIADQLIHSDGSIGMALSCKNRSTNNLPVQEGGQGEESRLEKKDYVCMDGQSVFRFAVKRVPECIKELLERNSLKAEEIACFVLHQANERIIASVAKRLSVPEEKFPMNLHKYGNTSAASIPILLDELKRGKHFKNGDKIVISGFGGGLSWGAVLAEIKC